MSAGSVTCNLSTKPQQVHRDGENSHNDIILDRWRILGGDRWLFFSPPSFSPEEKRPVKVSPSHFPPECIYPRAIFLHTCCWFINLETTSLWEPDLFPPARLIFRKHIWSFLCFWPLDGFRVVERLCISCESLCHVVGIDTCFMYLPGKAIFQITLSWAHSTFSFPTLIYFSSSWPLLSPRQFSQRKTAESAKLFYLEVELEVLKSIACDSQTLKILSIPSLTSPPLQHVLTVYQHWAIMLVTFS